MDIRSVIGYDSKIAANVQTWTLFIGKERLLAMRSNRFRRSSARGASGLRRPLAPRADSAVVQRPSLPFNFFDPDEEVHITRRHLPHWEQSVRTYFITFRTDDSIPADVLDRWHWRRRDWLLRHGINPDRNDWPERLACLEDRFQRQFHETVSREFHNHLDDCHGACVLRQPELAKLVEASLHHFDGDRYQLGDFVVMPNHVHVLVQMLGGIKLKKQCSSWKHYTAVQINRELKQQGRFWQEESFEDPTNSSGCGGTLPRTRKMPG
jgi:hypothetical protein